MRARTRKNNSCRSNQNTGGTDLVSQQDEWLLSLIDIITLLLAVFAIMFTLNHYKKAESATISLPQAAVETTQKTNGHNQPNSQNVVNDSLHKKPVEQSRLEDKRQSLIEELEKVIENIENKDDLKLAVGEQQIDLSIGEAVLFDLGDASLLPLGQAVIRSIQPVLAKGSYAIVVEGFSDDLPIRNKRYPSNWELSSARASSVARYLVSMNIQPQRLQVSGFADTRPVASNETEQGRKLNRRVNLRLRIAR